MSGAMRHRATWQGNRLGMAGGKPQSVAASLQAQSAKSWAVSSHSPPGRDRVEGKSQGPAMESSEHAKETKTAEELAAMIHADLSKMDGCPPRGVNVTVYGIPWKSMLTFGVAAGPVRNKAELQKFFEIITERLQRLYDVA
jgi:hypothetical protein